MPLVSLQVVLNHDCWPLVVGIVFYAKEFMNKPEVHQVSKVDGNEVVHVIVRTLVQEEVVLHWHLRNELPNLVDVLWLNVPVV